MSLFYHESVLQGGLLEARRAQFVQQGQNLGGALRGCGSLLLNVHFPTKMWLLK